MRKLTSLLLVPLLGACAHQAAPSKEAAPVAQACPSSLTEGTRCLAGRDSAGAFYLIVMPKDWNGDLVLHAHGGPFLGEPTARRVEEDLQRWSLMPRAGYAWAASSFRQGGVAVRAAAEDTERLRQIFISHMAKPKLTLLHGQSWGASVAAIAAETYGRNSYDGVLLTSGMLAGGTRGYAQRLDLRVIYQYLCGNHPRPDETQYPLWMGLPAGSTMTSAELARRANECLGLNRPATERSAEQARKLKTITDVIRIPANSVQAHLNWGTFHFQDVVHKRTGGANPFGNIGARYTGSADDAALNAGVSRYATSSQAVAAFGADADPTGRIAVPVLAVHGIQDPTVFVEVQHSFAQTMQAAGRADTLVQTYSDDKEHSYLSDATYAALLEALHAWVQQGRKPTPQAIAAGCVAAQARFPSTCRFQPDYRPAALETRVPARER